MKLVYSILKNRRRERFEDFDVLSTAALSCRTVHVTKHMWHQVQYGVDRAVGLHHGVQFCYSHYLRRLLWVCNPVCCKKQSLQCQYQIIGSLSSAAAAAADTSLCDVSLSFRYRRIEGQSGLHFELELSKKENFSDC